MFAPKVAQPQTKANEDLSSLVRARSTVTAHCPHSPVEQALLLQRTIGNQATLRLLAQRPASVATSQSGGDHKPKLPPGNTLASDRVRRPQPLSPLDTALLPGAIQAKLVVGQANDPLEHEADRVADQVMQIPSPELSIAFAPPQVSRKCAACEVEEKTKLQMKPIGVPDAAGREAPAIAQEVFSSPGAPLDAATRAFFEPRFGYDFSQGRVHADEKAAASARAVGALAYTAGRDIVFVAGQRTRGPTALLAHELVHVVQQHQVAAASQLQRQGDSGQEGTDGGAAGCPSAGCAHSPNCPDEFCLPFPSRKAAEADRESNRETMLASIPITRVLGIFAQYINGGVSSRQDLSSQFGKDFTESDQTVSTTEFLTRALKAALNRTPPVFPPNEDTVTVNIQDVIPAEIGQIGDPSNPNRMRFANVNEVPGLLAGGIDKTEASCPVGAIPSTFDDARDAQGTAVVTKNPDGTLFVGPPTITFTVVDTVDFCPGNCGGSLAQDVTVPMSRWEASCISGDVPFIVRFPQPVGAVGSEEA